MKDMSINDALTTGDDAWAELQAALDSRTDAIGPEPGDQWNPRDVYAHLARWQADSVRVVSLLLAGEQPPAPEADEETLNTRWAAEDARLSLAAAREACLATRQELRDLMLTLTPDQWREWGWKIEDIVGPHYRAHLAALVKA